MSEEKRWASQSEAHITKHDTSTAREYFRAAEETNAAAVQIDKGREPHLVSLELFAMSMHCYIAIWDVLKERRYDDKIVVTTERGDVAVDDDTIIAWM